MHMLQLYVLMVCVIQVCDCTQYIHSVQEIELQKIKLQEIKLQEISSQHQEVMKLAAEAKGILHSIQKRKDELTKQIDWTKPAVIQLILVCSL